MEFPAIPDLKTFDERLAFYADVRVERDRYTWVLGLGAYTECVERSAGGRPSPDEMTIAKFAGLLGEKPGPMGEFRNNYGFWKDDFTSIPDNASWRQCADARRASGWIPGTKLTRLHIQRALDWLLKKVDATPSPPDARPAWRRRWERARVILAEIESDESTPALVRLAVRTLLGQIAERMPDTD